MNRTTLASLLLMASSLTAEDLTIPPPEAELHPSGLVSQVLELGTGTVRPSPTDRVQAHFVARKADGTLFMDSSKEPRTPILDLQRVFPGLREGLGLMVEGERRRLWIPPGLGSAKEKEVVVFDLELVAILRDPTPPEDLLHPPAEATATPAGARTRVLSAGSGSRHPSPGDGAVLHYTGWTTDGQVFDSSSSRGKPTLFPLGKVMPAFAECVVLMVEGERRRCWIPERLARGNWVGKPKGDLVFDLELVRFIDGDKLLQSGRDGG